MFEEGDFVPGAGAVGTKPPIEPPPPELPLSLASELARRYDGLPVVRIRSRRAIQALDHAESKWIRSALQRYPLSGAVKDRAEEWWRAQVVRACGSVIVVLEKLEAAGAGPELPPQPWRPTWLFQLWWNTLGPGARTWVRNRRASFRRVTHGFRWRH